MVLRVGGLIGAKLQSRIVVEVGKVLTNRKFERKVFRNEDLERQVEKQSA